MTENLIICWLVQIILFHIKAGYVVRHHHTTNDDILTDQM